MATDSKRAFVSSEKCTFTFCPHKPGGGTWMDIMIQGIRYTVPVCEQHWQALRAVKY